MACARAAAARAAGWRALTTHKKPRLCPPLSPSPTRLKGRHTKEHQEVTYKGLSLSETLRTGNAAGGVAAGCHIAQPSAEAVAARPYV